MVESSKYFKKVYIMSYNKLCEMDIGELMNSVMGQVQALKPDQEQKQGSCNIQKPIQPDDDVGKFGNETDIKIQLSQDGGLEINSKEMAIKLSSTILEALKTFLSKGEN